MYQLTAKSEVVNKAREVFTDCDTDVVPGHRVLESVIGSKTESDKFLSDKAYEYKNVLQKLSKHAKTSTQNVYKSITAGVQHKSTFISRTTPDTNNLLAETEKVIHEQLLPSIVNHANYDDLNRKNFSLPVLEGPIFGIFLYLYAT